MASIEAYEKHIYGWEDENQEHEKDDVPFAKPKTIRISIIYIYTPTTIFDYVFAHK